MRTVLIDIDFPLQDILTMIQDFSRIRCFQQVDTAKQCRLTAATGSDNGDYLPFIAMKIDVIQYLQRTEMLFQMSDFYDRIHIIHSPFLSVRSERTGLTFSAYSYVPQQRREAGLQVSSAADIKLPQR